MVVKGNRFFIVNMSQNLTDFDANGDELIQYFAEICYIFLNFLRISPVVSKIPFKTVDNEHYRTLLLIAE